MAAPRKKPGQTAAPAPASTDAAGEAAPAAVPEQEAGTAATEQDETTAPANPAEVAPAAPEPEPEPEPEAVEHIAAAPVPVTKYVLVRGEDEPVRAGGHVLTENGWLPESTLSTVDDD